MDILWLLSLQRIKETILSNQGRHKRLSRETKRGDIICMNESIKEVVESVLKEFPITRDDDFLLCIRVFLRLGYAHALPEGKIQIDLKNIQYAPAFETITRERRNIQYNEKRYPASPETQARRIMNEIKTHSRYSHSTKQMSPYTYPSTFW
jgi:hypothetical protein